MHRFVNFVDYYFELFFDAETNGPLSLSLSLYIYIYIYIYLLNRSIVHAIRMHVSEVPCSGAVSAHTICVLRQSPNEPHSGPPLTTKPGPAKTNRVQARHGVITLLKRTGLWGSDAARGWFKTPSVGKPLENNRIT